MRDLHVGQKEIGTEAYNEALSFFKKAKEIALKKEEIVVATTVDYSTSYDLPAGFIDGHLSTYASATIAPLLYSEGLEHIQITDDNAHVLLDIVYCEEADYLEVLSAFQ